MQTNYLEKKFKLIYAFIYHFSQYFSSSLESSEEFNKHVELLFFADSVQKGETS